MSDPRSSSRLPSRSLGPWTLAGACALTLMAVGCGLASSNDATTSGGTGRGLGESDPVNGPVGTSSGEPVQRTPARVETFLVHASPDLPAMRLCLEVNDDEPIPTDNIMPRTNQVGVDVGGAATLGALAQKAKPGSTALLFRASVTERRDEFGTPQRHQSCKSYRSGAEKNVDFWEVTMPALDPSSLLVITGCRTNCATPPTLVSVSLASIGVPKDGNLFAGFVSFAPDLDGPEVSVDLQRGGSRNALLTNGELSTATLVTPLELNWDKMTESDISGSKVVVARKDAPVLEGSFGSMAGYVDIASEPTLFYNASRIVFVALGSSSWGTDHPQRGLHMLALPLDNAVKLVPEPRPDGGAPPNDAGTKAD